MEASDPLFYKLLENKKRTYQMFQSQMDAPIMEDEALIRQKAQLKFNRFYSDIGKIPGYQLEERKRRKILQEMGIESKPQTKKEEESKGEGEPKIEDAPPVSSSMQKAIQQIKKE